MDFDDSVHEPAKQEIAGSCSEVTGGWGLTVKKLLSVLAVAATAMVVTPAKAIDGFGSTFGQHWYVQGMANAFLPPNSEIDVNGPGLGSGTWNEEDGYSFSLTVGTSIAPQWRGELELSLSHGEDGKVYLGGPSIPHSGDVDGYGAMVNVLYDPDFSGYLLRPFLGAGIGLVHIDIDNHGAVGGTFTVNDDDTAFVANLIAGVEVPLTPMISLTGRYRAGFITHTNYDTTAAGIDVDSPTQFFNVLSAGVRVNLN